MNNTHKTMPLGRRQFHELYLYDNIYVLVKRSKTKFGKIVSTAMGLQPVYK